MEPTNNRMGRPRKTHAAIATAEELQKALTENQVPAGEPGNETAPDAKSRRNGRAKAQELPHVEGPGVSPTNKFNVLV